MAIFGRPEIEYYQLTPVGVARLQTPGVNLGPSTQKVLETFGELGGTAERDELRFRTYLSGHALNNALNRLLDLGYIQPVSLTGETEQPV